MSRMVFEMRWSPVCSDQLDSDAIDEYVKALVLSWRRIATG